MINNNVSGSKIAKDAALRLAIAASPSAFSLTIEIQSLPATAAVLNSHPLLSHLSTLTVQLKAIPRACSFFFREKGLVGPRPTFFIFDDKELFIQNLSQNQYICSGTA